MKNPILTFLARDRRKLIATRVVEAAAVGAVSAALAGVMLQLAWIIARVQLSAAIAITIATVTAGIAIGSSKFIGRLLRLTNFESKLTAIALTLVGIAGLVLVASGYYLRVPPIYIPLVAWLGGAIWGAGCVLAMPASIIETGAFMDRRWNLSECLATASQLAIKGNITPMGKCVCDQALAAAQATHTRGGMWVKTRVLLSLTTLVAMLSITFATINPRGITDNTSSIAIFAKNLAKLSPAQRESLARSLRKQADALDDAAISRQLDMVATAAEKLDADKVKELLEELASAGLTLDDLVSENILETAGASKTHQQNKSSHNNDTTTPHIEPVAGISKGEVTGVYNPLYKTTAGKGDSAISRKYMIGIDDAWSLARRRAEDASLKRNISPQRRLLLRDYFGINSTMINYQ